MKKKGDTADKRERRLQALEKILEEANKDRKSREILEKLRPYYEQKAKEKQILGGKEKVMQKSAEPLLVRKILAEKAKENLSNAGKGLPTLANLNTREVSILS